MNPVQWTSLFTFLFMWWIELFHMLGFRINYKHYLVLRRRIIPKLPPGIFTIINNVVFPLAAVAGHQYLNWTTPNRSLYDAVLALYLATLILEKLWTPVFFRLRWLWGAFLIVLMAALTAISALVIIWVDTRNNGVSNYVAGGLFIPYVLWVCYRLLLNLDIAYHNGHVHFTYYEDVGPSGRRTKHLAVLKHQNPSANAPTLVYAAGSKAGSRVPYSANSHW